MPPPSSSIHSLRLVAICARMRHALRLLDLGVHGNDDTGDLVEAGRTDDNDERFIIMVEGAGATVGDPDRLPSIFVFFLLLFFLSLLLFHSVAHGNKNEPKDIVDAVDVNDEDSVDVVAPRSRSHDLLFRME